MEYFRRFVLIFVIINTETFILGKLLLPNQNTLAFILLRDDQRSRAKSDQSLRCLCVDTVSNVLYDAVDLRRINSIHDIRVYWGKLNHVLSYDEGTPPFPPHPTILAKV